jgi:hypothetical protein
MQRSRLLTKSSEIDAAHAVDVIVTTMRLCHHWRTGVLVLALSTATLVRTESHAFTANQLHWAKGNSACAMATTVSGATTTFCASAGVCDVAAAVARGAHADSSVPTNCSVVDQQAYIQRAVYWVSGRDVLGHVNASVGDHRGGTVQLNGGHHVVGAALDAWCVARHLGHFAPHGQPEVATKRFMSQ